MASAPPEAADTTVLSPLPLGIPGLPPDACDLLPGGMYALKARTSTARLPMFAALLESALQAGRTCFLVTSSRPDEFLARLQSYWEISAEQLIADGLLKIFCAQEEIPKKMFRYGADRFLQELTHYGMKDGDVLVYDQADDLLSLHDAFLALQQVEVLARGFQRLRITTLLSFSRPSDRQEDPFNALMDHFSGISRLGGDRDGLELTFLYWRASGGVTAARNFRLQTDDHGRYQAVEFQRSAPRQERAADASPYVVDDRRGGAPRGEAPEPASDHCFIYNDPALDTLGAEIAGSWLRVLGFDEIFENAQGLERASILLNIGGVDDLQHMAEGIHQLRLHLSNKIQIVAYADPVDLPPAESQLLLRCGANAVVPVASVPDQLPPMLRNITRQVYIRRIEAEFELLWTRYLEEQMELAESVQDEAVAPTGNEPAAPSPFDSLTSNPLRQPVSGNRRQEVAFSRPPIGPGGYIESDADATTPATQTIGKAKRSSIAQ